MSNSSCIVVLSGGQDSTTCLYWAIKNFDVVHTVTFDYGQRHRIEIESAKKVATLAGIEEDNQHLIEIPPTLLRSRSPLTQSDVDLEQYESFEKMQETIGDRVELTFVPLRNMMFLTIAANLAVSLNIWNLVTGVCQEDTANYPDCRKVFVAGCSSALNLALGTEDNFDAGNRVKIITPLMYLTKAQSIQMAIELDNGAYDALAYSHTSYDGKYPPIDMNHANVLRANGFEEAGVPDPLVVRAYQEGLMPLPSSPNYDTIRNYVGETLNEAD